MTQIKTGTTRWKSPSNIALIKYWGKYENQIPANPSLSFTLKNSYSETYIEYKKSTSNETYVDFYFEGMRNEQFAQRVKAYINVLTDLEPGLKGLGFKISSRNSFPHSSGIASSASSMSALALGLTDIVYQLNGQHIDTPDFFRKASKYARLGSGSACRSVYPKIVLWGHTAAVPGSSNEEAIQVTDQIHQVYDDFCDSILIIDAGKKKISSSEGHRLMNNHPFAKKRFAQANRNLKSILELMKTDDVYAFLKLVESEALSLHSMMLTSSPYFILMKPGTLAVIEKIRMFRERKLQPVGFTLDAGANVHLLYPSSVKAIVLDFINEELLSFCDNNQVIHDEVGSGPVKMSQSK